MTTIEATLTRALAAIRVPPRPLSPAVHSDTIREDNPAKKAVKIYEQEVCVPEDTRTYLLLCNRNHLIVFNDILEVYRRNRTMTYKELKLKLNEYLSTTDLHPLIPSVLHAEIYYMSKKSDFQQKLLTAIQYITAVSRGYRWNKVFRHDASGGKLWVGNAPSFIPLPVSFPDVEPDQVVYINLSFSSTSGNFALSVFAAPV